MDEFLFKSLKHRTIYIHIIYKYIGIKLTIYAKYIYIIQIIRIKTYYKNN